MEGALLHTALSLHLSTWFGAATTKSRSGHGPPRMTWSRQAAKLGLY
jgi:hypothetical protein